MQAVPEDCKPQGWSYVMPKKDNRCWLGRLLRPVLLRVLDAQRMQVLDLAWSWGYFLTRSKWGAYLSVVKKLQNRKEY